MKKRVFAALMAAVTVAGLLAGCGGTSADTSSESSSETTEESTETSSADTEGKTVISFWHYMSTDKEGKFVQEAVDEFNESQDEIYVETQYLPREELMKQYTIGVVSGELPDVGIHGAHLGN